MQADQAFNHMEFMEHTDADGGIALVKAWPNPFKSQTSLRFDLDHDQPVKVNIVSADGHRIRTLTTGFMVAGQHHVTWDGRDNAGLAVGSGVYFAVVSGETETRTLKLALMH